MNKIIQAVRELAAEKAKFRYTEQPERKAVVAALRHDTDEGNIPCSYSGVALGSTEGQGCIIGQAIVKAGLATREELADHEQRHGGVGVTGMASRKPEWFDGAIQYELFWMSSVQTQQDYGKPWGQAVAYADNANPLIGTTNTTQEG